MSEVPSNLKQASSKPNMTETDLFHFRTSLLFQWKVGYYCTQNAETGQIPK